MTWPKVRLAPICKFQLETTERRVTCIQSEISQLWTMITQMD
jgi:hypothetical protein